MKIGECNGMQEVISPFGTVGVAPGLFLEACPLVDFHNLVVAWGTRDSDSCLQVLEACMCWKSVRYLRIVSD